MLSTGKLRGFAAGDVVWRDFFQFAATIEATVHRYPAKTQPLFHTARAKFTSNVLDQKLNANPEFRQSRTLCRIRRRSLKKRHRGDMILRVPLCVLLPNSFNGKPKASVHTRTLAVGLFDFRCSIYSIIHDSNHPASCGRYRFTTCGHDSFVWTGRGCILRWSRQRGCCEGGV